MMLFTRKKNTLKLTSSTLRCFSFMRKNVNKPMSTAYQTEFVENDWYEWWDKQGFFKPESNKISKGKFSMIIPPPNVTGTLHLGHALANAVEDALVRWHRMKGYSTVWFPGCDHAGIATQTVVEKLLQQEEKKTRHDMGDEKFMQYLNEWKEKKMNRIYEQLKRLGSSLDWSRSSFTMDAQFTEAVIEAFIQLHDEGLIYRDKKFINWCCYLQSTISDIEVNKVELLGRTQLSIPQYKNPMEFGVLYYIKYKSATNPSEFITVATTRPETIFGDVAISFHPEGKGLTIRDLSDSKVYNPLTGKEMMLFNDVTVDPDFGTGAVKITPAHDVDDYNRAKLFKIDNFVEVIDDKGLMNENCGEFQGLPRYECRKAIIGKLKAEGLLSHEESHPMVLPVCSRSGDIIELKRKSQWFLKTNSLAQLAMDAVKDGCLEIIPNRYEKLWFHWLTNSRDWCLSRQLLWGHRIPAYRVLNDKSDVWVSARNMEEAKEKARNRLSIDNIILEQEKDVLDTWFSSALFPFACMGWPNQTNDFKKFYPLDLMETGHDILFFWVVRMVMLGLKLTNTLPFRRVLLHGIVCDSYGQKMSKSLGNVIDPLDIINGVTLEQLHHKTKTFFTAGILSKDEYKKAIANQTRNFPDGIAATSADALRFALCSYNIEDQSINLDVKRTLRYRLFCNKIWQASKFVFNVLNMIEDHSKLQLSDVESNLSVLDKWILSCLSSMVKTSNEAFEAFAFHRATKSVHDFFYLRFCDVYLEAIKPIIQSKNQNDIEVVATVLLTCLHTSLLTMSPFMPFLTEELYQRLPIANRATSINIASYPDTIEWSKWESKFLNDNMEIILSIVQSVRCVCNDFLLKEPIVTVIGTATLCDELLKLKFILQNLLKNTSISILRDYQPKENELLRIINSDISICIASQGNKVDQERLVAELSKRANTFNKKLEKIINQMNSPRYLKTITPERHDEFSTKKAILETKLKEVNNNLSELTLLIKS